MAPQMEKWRELEMAIHSASYSDFRSASYSDFRSEYEKADQRDRNSEKYLAQMMAVYWEHHLGLRSDCERAD